jgi:hypothetical protein
VRTYGAHSHCQCLTMQWGFRGFRVIFFIVALHTPSVSGTKPRGKRKKTYHRKRRSKKKRYWYQKTFNFLLFSSFFYCRRLNSKLVVGGLRSSTGNEWWCSSFGGISCARLYYYYFAGCRYLGGGAKSVSYSRMTVEKNANAKDKALLLDDGREEAMEQEDGKDECKCGLEPR